MTTNAMTTAAGQTAFFSPFRQFLLAILVTFLSSFLVERYLPPFTFHFASTPFFFALTSKMIKPDPAAGESRRALAYKRLVTAIVWTLNASFQVRAFEKRTRRKVLGW